MTGASFVAQNAWMGYWQAMRRYHRFEVRGLEHVLGLGPALLVGYHGRPGARDLCMLQATLLFDYGQSTRAVAHDLVFKIPGVPAIADGFAFVSRRREDIARAVASGHKLVVAPGGLAEAWGSFRRPYRVRWGEGVGYLRLAIEHRLPIVPLGATGVDEAFYGMFDAYELWKRVGAPAGVGVWLGVGPLGIWPFTPPFPTRIIQYVAPPIDLRAEGLDESSSKEQLLGVHGRISAIVQGLLDRGQAETRGRTWAAQTVRWVDQQSE
jgi:1-acyl-sn-glycerol-3-phosphate acyltransferase